MLFKFFRTFEESAAEFAFALAIGAQFTILKMLTHLLVCNITIPIHFFAAVLGVFTFYHNVL